MNNLLKGGLALGGTALAVGGLRWALSSEPRYAPWEKPRFADFENRVLILGGGFGGYNVAKSICEMTRKRDDVGVMVISRENYLTFWPMVPGVVSSDVGVRNIAQPLRRTLIHLGASFRRAEVEDVDFEKRTVTADGHEFPYDHLVFALGAEPNFFGIPGVEKHALPMKGISDAVRIRNRVIERFEQAVLEGGEIPESALTFVVIGAGATGVETAAQLHVLIHEVLAQEYPNVNPNRFRIMLLDALPNILPELDAGLRRVARGQLAARDIEVLTNAMAEEVTEDRVRLKDGREIHTQNVIWTAGARPNSLVEKLGLPLVEKTKGIKVDEYLRVEGFRNVWALGDNATIPNLDDGFVPPNAQAAVKEGKHLAKNILAAIDGRELKPFKYRSQGQLIDLGSHFAVNDVFGVKFSGRLASLFWRGAYLVRLDSPQGRVRQAFDWALEYFAHPTVAQIRDYQAAE
ncbi:NAD(P)/FAD-dependent oxidoreductase [Rubrobacter naiadicus]|uniref:NAD(P)/FAD-dependent oxidoreductase n=1 Tax=Rubrobacter naiadicus TaxID=1392641 RepID=UPI002360F8F5|nr:NAD(P)/FAD-dependent oxidoreductase [Rubrobacter naiadicus]